MKKTLLLLIVLSLFHSHSILGEPAEDHSGDEKSTESAETKRRSAGATQLKEKEVNILSAVFRLPVGFIRDFYGADAKDVNKNLPKAIDQAMEGSETMVSTILAELMGTLNEQQVTT